MPTTLFEKPHQLITTDVQTKQLHYVEKTLDLLRNIDKHVNAVAITGEYRSGKSYLLNRLAGGSKGFSIGKTTNACTKGIWIWCKDHPVQPDQILVLLDVEGFGDICKGEKEHLLLFTLATLLCSTMVYNNKGAFDLAALNRMRFLKDMESNVCVVNPVNDLDLLDFFFPKLIVCLRDLSLDFTTQTGEPTSPDGYLEDVLGQQKGDDDEIKTSNEIRLLIRNYFNVRKCFRFKTPSLNPNDMDRMKDTELNQDFLESLKAFQNHVYNCKPMTMKSGQAINGRMFASLVRVYLEHVSEGKTPCMRAAFKEIENEFVLEHASVIYSEEMKRRLAAINPNERAFVNHHQQCMEKAVEYFRIAVVFDDEQVCFKQMQVRFRELFEKFKRICDKNSQLQCFQVLDRLNLKIVRKLNENEYAKKGGYAEYIEDVEMLQKRYNGTAGMGTKSRECLQAFLDDKAEEEAMVYKLAAEASRKDNGNNLNVPRLEERRTSLNPCTTIYGEISEEIENLRQRLGKEYEKRQGRNSEHIKKKHIEVLSLKLLEVKRQLQEDIGENLEELKDYRKQLTDMIDAYEQTDALSDEFKEKMRARPLDTVYEFQPTTLTPDGTKKAQPNSSLKKKKRNCYVQ